VAAAADGHFEFGDFFKVVVGFQGGQQTATPRASPGQRSGKPRPLVSVGVGGVSIDSTSVGCQRSSRKEAASCAHWSLPLLRFAAFLSRKRKKKKLLPVCVSVVSVCVEKLIGEIVALG